jgi:hypothetical protein
MLLPELRPEMEARWLCGASVGDRRVLNNEIFEYLKYVLDNSTLYF